MATFTLPAPNDSTLPMVETHVFQWADAQPDRDSVRLENYLQACGFVLGKDRLSESDYDYVKTVVDYWHVCTPRIRQPIRFADHFQPVQSGGYWVDGKPGRYAPSQFILQALTDAGWIYEPSPDNTYFRVSQNGILSAVYQQIIGSRRLAVLSE